MLGIYMMVHAVEMGKMNYQPGVSVAFDHKI